MRCNHYTEFVPVYDEEENPVGSAKLVPNCDEDGCSVDVQLPWKYEHRDFYWDNTGFHLNPDEPEEPEETLPWTDATRVKVSFHEEEAGC